MNHRVYESESGRFLCDEQGIVQEFEPAAENIIAEKQYRHLIVPEGVVGFCDNFGFYFTVTERFELPGSLREIGRDNEADWTLGRMNVFSRAYLPTVIIPETVESIGVFAFGGSHIETLCLPPRAFEKMTPYLRQFKDSRIRKLYWCGDFTHLRLDAWFQEVYIYKPEAADFLTTRTVLTLDNRWYNGIEGEFYL